MRCPKCNYLCSDLRDVCGKCFVDLRPKKQELGIKIMNPGASHEELVSKIARRVTPSAQTAQSTGSGFLGGLKSLFRAAPQEQPEWEAIPSLQAHPEPAESFTPPPKVAKPVVQMPKEALSPEIESKVGSQQAPSDEAAIPVPVRSAAVAAPKRDRFADSGNAAINDLWEAAQRSIDERQSVAQFEFSTAALRNFSKEREEIEVLWALVDEAIQDPASLERYASITPSAVREIRAEEAERALQRVEKSMSAQVFSLGRGGPRLSRRDEETTVASVVRFATHDLNPATANERLTAGIIDAAYIALLSFICTLSITWFAAPELRSFVLRPLSLPAPELISLTAVFFSTFIALGVLYPWLSGTRTAGQKLLGIEVIEESGRDATPTELFLRAAMLPLSLLVSAVIPPLWRTIGFHNRLSHTLINRTDTV